MRTPITVANFAPSFDAEDRNHDSNNQLRVGGRFVGKVHNQASKVGNRAQGDENRNSPKPSVKRFSFATKASGAFPKLQKERNGKKKGDFHVHLSVFLSFVERSRKKHGFEPIEADIIQRQRRLFDILYRLFESERVVDHKTLQGKNDEKNGPEERNPRPDARHFDKIIIESKKKDYSDNK